MRITKLAACLATLSSPLMAADLENPNHTNMPVTALDAVTVTATRTAKSALNSAQAVNVINAVEAELLCKAELGRKVAINVDDFVSDELRAQSASH